MDEVDFSPVFFFFWLLYGGGEGLDSCGLRRRRLKGGWILGLVPFWGWDCAFRVASDDSISRMVYLEFLVAVNPSQAGIR